MRTMLTAITALALVGTAEAQTTPDIQWGDGGVSAFYTWTEALPDKPGQLLRTEPLPSTQMLADAASGERILYTATDGVSGSGLVVVSGAYFTPKGEPPPGGWPLIAWAHGTVGVADVCAPSWAGRSDRDVHYLSAWLANGFAIVATDYQGLGTPGPHPYLETRPEAFSMLDGVRAIKGRHDAELSGQVVIVGQSQGAGAAFATAALADTYAPDVDVRATVATGTPYITKETLSRASNSDIDRVDPTIAYVYYLTLTAQQRRPELNASDIFTDKALTLFEQARSLCVGPLFRAVVAAGLTRHDALKPQGLTGVFGPLVPALVYSSLHIKGPIFMGAGAEDKDVNPNLQMKLAADACAAGSTVEAHLYAGLDHSGTVNASLKHSVPFVRKALAGEPITLRCTPEPEIVPEAGIPR